MLREKVAVMSECASLTVHYNGHEDVLKLRDAYGTIRCSMARDTPDSPGSRHWAATCSASQQTAMKTHPHLLTTLKAVAVSRYDTMHIPQRRMSMASLEVTGRHHWASTCSNNIHQTCLCTHFLSTCWNRREAKGWPLITVGYNISNWWEAIK